MTAKKLPPEQAACRERTPEELAAYIDALTKRIRKNAEARRGRS